MAVWPIQQFMQYYGHHEAAITETKRFPSEDWFHYCHFWNLFHTLICSLAFLIFFFSFTESLKPYFTHKPKNITAKLHSSTTVVKCSAKGLPKPTVKWVRYTGSSETVIRSGGRFIVFGNLYIFHLQWSDSGKYGCVAQNKYGRAEAHFYITVQTGM